jgi:hypothetical protein
MNALQIVDLRKSCDALCHLDLGPEKRERALVPI